MGTTVGVKIRTMIWERDLGFPSPDTGPGTASQDRHWAAVCLSTKWSRNHDRTCLNCKNAVAACFPNSHPLFSTPL